MSYKNSSICMKVMIVAGFLLILQPAKSQTAGFDGLTETLTANQKAMGNNFVAMIWQGDTVVYKKEFGELNAKTAVPIADASKWLTAALVMQFVDEGKISLDDKITKWLPEYARYGKNYITIRLCLANMTGIQYSDKTPPNPFRKKTTTLEEEVNAYASREIQTNPGTEFRYNNMGADIAGRVLEVLSKKRFDMLIRQKLFVPMGMRRTTFTNMEGGAVSPSDGAQSSAEDYIKFLGMLLNKGKYGGKQILSEESVNTMMQSITTLNIIKSPPKSMQGYDYAMGSWVMEADANAKSIVLSCPSFTGTWPVIDYCRGYAYLILSKKLFEEDKAEVNKQVKSVLDEKFGSQCK
ncbi:MAG: serine hydrolase [Chitinophagaceae bacterium]|nr:serine hydrolase [Chitinophagaceae bacterium]